MSNWLINQKLDPTANRYSQSDQDAVIDYIFSNLKPKNDPPFCVEFGFNSDSLTSGSGANVANLVVNKGWKCLLLDGSFENPSINLHKHVISSENIRSIFRDHNVPKEPEYVSIDLDSVDLWVFDDLLIEYSPMVVSVEYNCNFPIDKAIAFVNDSSAGMLRPTRMFRGKKASYNRIFGSSLKALKMVGEKHGYTLSMGVTRYDLFFIRDDLTGGYERKTEDFCQLVAPHVNAHAPYEDDSDIFELFLDYEVFLETGDIEKSKQAALPVCEQYLKAPSIALKG